MIKYKVIQVTGNKREITENNSIEFDRFYPALEYFYSIDIYLEILKDWSSASEIGRKLLIDMDAFLEYDLVKYDTDDEFYTITLHKKSKSFREIND